MPVAKKRVQKVSAYSLADPIKCGFNLCDSHKRNWILGKPIGQGGFGCIYAAKLSTENHETYVAKIEPQENGPLFTEIHFYIRVCASDSITKWMDIHRTKFLGIPRYVSSGLCTPPNQKPCRFLVMDRYSGDLEHALKNGKVHSTQLVRSAMCVLDALEYIHSKDYAHADIKAANLLYKNSVEEVTLVDFGLVHLFRIRGVHCADKPDPKFKGNGTLEFCSRDSHQGRPPSRRGDLEILAYNVVHWLARSLPTAPQAHTTGLPWGHLISDPGLRQNVPERIRMQVAGLKETHAKDPSSFLRHVNLVDTKHFLTFLRSIFRLDYDETPDYKQLRNNLTELHQSFSKTVKSRNPTHKRSSTENLPNVVEKKPHVAETHNQLKRTPLKLVQPSNKASPKPKPASSRRKQEVNVVSQASTVMVTDSKSGKTPNYKSANSPIIKSESAGRSTGRRKIATGESVPTVSSLPLSSTTNLSTPFSDDSEDEFDRLIRSRSRTATLSRSKTSRKVDNIAGAKASLPVIKQSVVVRSRKSGCCQTSPDLLLLAKAEALKHRALRVANRRSP